MKHLFPVWCTYVLWCENGGQKVSLQSPKLSFISKPIFELTLRDSLRRSHATIFFRATPAPPYFLPPSGFLFECVMCVRVMLSKIQISCGLQCARTPNFIPAVPRWGIALDCLMSGTVNNAYHKRKSNDILSYLWTLFSVSLKHLNWYK